MLKYGYLSFSFQVLEYVDTSGISNREKIVILRKLEQKYLDDMLPEYNILKFAGSNLGHKLSTETRLKMSAAKKNKPSPRRGITISEHTRNRISANSTSKRAVKIYSNKNQLLNEFSSIQECRASTGISRHRIGRAMKSNSLVNDKYFFKSPYYIV